MWTPMTRSDLTRRFGSAGLGAALVAAAGLAMAGPAAAQQQYDEHYEWEPDEGVHEEEWYDPSDWFDDWFDERRVDYESDWWEDDEYDDYSENYYDYAYGNQGYDYEYDDEYDVYRVYYYSDLYSDQQQAQRDGARQRQDQRMDQQRRSQQSQTQQGQTRQGQQGQTQQRQGQPMHDRQTQRGAELRGEVDDWKRVSLQGQRDAHTLVRLRLQDGSRKVVNLGPNVDVKRLDLQQGDQIAVYGQSGSINDRNVLMAQRIRVGQNTIRMDNWNPGQHQAMGQSQQGRQSQQDRTASQWQRSDRQNRQSQRYSSQVQQGQRQAQQRQDRRSAMHAGQQSQQGMHRDAQMVQRMISDWPDASRKAAESMLGKYGKPDGVTPEMLVWRNTGPFVKTIVHGNAVEHNFPQSHQDVLEQAVNLKVPADKMDDLARFDGSLIVYRTDGLVSARCHKEAMNVLALNLAADIISDEKSVEQARQTYAQAATSYMNGDRQAITRKLQFDSQSRNIDGPNMPGERYRSGQSQSQSQDRGQGESQSRDQSQSQDRNRVSR